MSSLIKGFPAFFQSPCQSATSTRIVHKTSPKGVGSIFSIHSACPSNCILTPQVWAWTFKFTSSANFNLVLHVLQRSLKIHLTPTETYTGIHQAVCFHTSLLPFIGDNIMSCRSRSLARVQHRPLELEMSLSVAKTSGYEIPMQIT